jgi:hypothetical protein
MDDTPLAKQADERFKTRMESKISRIFEGAPCKSALTFTGDELTSATLAPDCIVDEYLYADVACKTAPGSTGKTTLELYECICIIIGRPLFGLPVRKSGWCLLVTAEDSRHRIAARLREIMAAMELTDKERGKVLANFAVWDVSGEIRKLIANLEGTIELTPLVDQIITAHQDDPPILVTFDPLVCFGTSEQQVNDNEQALIVAGRRIVRRLGCCVRFIAHTGKANARDKTLDQYTSRGGSALADGCRMVAVMQNWTEGDTKYQPPAGCTVTPGSSITILARPKISYAKPNLPLIWIKRTGFKFEHFTEVQQTKHEAESAAADQVERFIVSELQQGRKHTKKTLESALEGTLSRNQVRKALDALIVSNLVIMPELPKDEQQGARKRYLATAAYLAGNSEPSGDI